MSYRRKALRRAKSFLRGQKGSKGVLGQASPAPPGGKRHAQALRSRKRRGRLGGVEAGKRAFLGEAALRFRASALRERERPAEQILESVERERHRIGQDLHDGVCQLLSGIKFKVTLLEQKLRATGRPEAREASLIEALLIRAMQETHRVARGFLPAALQGRGLKSALRELAASMSDLYGTKCVCYFDPGSRVADPVLATHFYRLAQEAVSNAIRHGRATRVSLHLTGQPGALALTTRDNGRGLRAKPSGKPGLGLSLMKCRARAMGAALEIKPGRPVGTVATCRLGNHKKPDLV
jgi:two-component system sensor kinase FixL